MAPTDGPDPFASTERYYARYRPGYGAAPFEYLREAFDLDDGTRVLDLGCGAGQIAVPLAAYADEVVGMDPNGAMLRQAERTAAVAGRENVEWVVGSDANPDGSMGLFRLTPMGRSFHWMDQKRTLERLHRTTESGGGVAILADAEWFTRGERDWQDAVYDLAADYLDDLPERSGPVHEHDDPWDELIAEHGFTDVEVRSFASERAWDADGIVGYLFSLSYCSPETFGDDRAAFEAELRALLVERDEDRFGHDAEVAVIAGGGERDDPVVAPGHCPRVTPADTT
jgi:SAM-dependent methyltransferase